MKKPGLPIRKSINLSLILPSSAPFKHCLFSPNQGEHNEHYGNCVVITVMFVMYDYCTDHHPASSPAVAQLLEVLSGVV